ncbi:BZ3500_MvSof-1268-A1-R1_Chr9g10421 [Microbotryum saponariae]|uniref:BZ3500_MvSof-1268-A1-R1_Chr9g10421 protein n=1 Tax=Microbotryum saponariae TaxID=289078 RepID=A0A2X0L1P3_9BASI|nr:BZ3501_MvSof-1269-A2-R1_Chr9g10171 [Microbotryum saponariae]SDA00066.1 BZ3500_MvSof-1268-A1-R1_Chr9g10421 [Microbotryum saponariae]
MAAVASNSASTSSLGQQHGTPRQQKKLFRSISRFLSGGRSRPKLAPESSPGSRTTVPAAVAPNQRTNAPPPHATAAGTSSPASATGPRTSGTDSAQSSPRANNGAATSSAPYVDHVPMEYVGRGAAAGPPPALGARTSQITASSGGYDEEDELYPHSRRSMISSDAPTRHYDDDDDDETDNYSVGADTDASIRPISPASYAPSSIASSSFAPTHATHRSSTSTKPTTHLSIDSGGANRIAVVPGTGMLFSGTPAHAGLLSATAPSSSPLASVPPVNAPQPGDTVQDEQSTISAATSAGPSTPTREIAEPSLTHLAPKGSLAPHDASILGATHASNVPGHTLAHPRNNPHPNGPPPDNASMITLASSSFAPSVFARGPASPSMHAVSGIQRIWKEGGGAPSASGVTADEDASVRALAPSRRASDESLGSRSTWSAAVGRVGLGGPALSIKGRTPSIRTTGTGAEDLESAGPDIETEAQKVVRREGARNDAVVAKFDSLSAANAGDAGSVRSAPFMLGSGGLSRYLSASDSVKRGSPSISSSLRGIAPAPSEKGFGDDEDDVGSYVGTERDDEDATTTGEGEEADERELPSHAAAEPDTIISTMPEEAHTDHVNNQASETNGQRRQSLLLSTKLGTPRPGEAELVTPRVEKGGAFWRGDVVVPS